MKSYLTSTSTQGASFPSINNPQIKNIENRNILSTKASFRVLIVEIVLLVSFLIGKFIKKLVQNGCQIKVIVVLIYQNIVYYFTFIEIMVLFQISKRLSSTC